MKTIPATLMLAALALSACGGEDPAAAGGRQDAREATLDFARCMREQGIDFPDPKVDEDGGIRIGGPDVGGGDPAKLERAQKACQKHLDAIEPPRLTAEERARVKKEALAHARCMREAGIDFPDPEFPEEGGAQVRIGPGSGIDPRSPKFQRAQKVCAKELRGEGRLGGVQREESP